MRTAEQIADSLADTILQRLVGTQRQLIALAGPPAAGKSTIAEAVLHAVQGRGVAAGSLAMDGFHLDNTVLSDRGLLARKGAPETFDLAGFRAMVERLQGGEEVIAPTFDRAVDKSIAGSVVIPTAAQVIVVEGNYLLLDEPGWRDLAGFWDQAVFLDVPIDELERRLIERWLSYGLTQEEARARAMSNDIPNARRVVEHCVPADRLRALHIV